MPIKLLRHIKVFDITPKIDSRVFPAFPLMRKPECWAGFGGGLDSVGSDRSSSSCLQFPADSPPSKGCCSTLLGAPPIQGRGRLFLNVEPGETDPPKVVDPCCCQPNLSILSKDSLKIVDLVPAQDASRQRREVFQEDTVQGKVSFVGCHLSLVSLQQNTLDKITLCGQLSSS